MKRLFGFTLAETLIVMGIIGVVAALTLPNLNSSTGDKEKVAKVKKIYSNINDAMGRAVAIYGPINEWFKTDTSYATQSTRFATRLGEFLKVSKTCGLNNSSCFASTVKSFQSGSNYTISSSNIYSLVLSDGTALAFNMNKDWSDNYLIYFDIDGSSKGSNTASKDVFALQINPDTGEVKPYGYAYLDGTNSGMLDSGCFGDGHMECTAWVVEHGNMDYLKVDDFQGACRNNTSIKLDGVTNTTCK
ncbi:type II secretion system protein [bacterium]|nr:type II secretion system protein [bacterium]